MNFKTSRMVKNKNQVTSSNVNGTAPYLITSGTIDLKAKKVSRINKNGKTEVKNRVMFSLGVMGIGFDSMDRSTWKAILKKYLCE